MILSNDAKNALLQGLASALNVGDNAKLLIYIDDVAVVNFIMPNPIQQSVANGVLTFNLPEKVLATESGTPTSAKLFSSDGTEFAEFTIGSDITLSRNEFYMGGYVSLTSLAINI